ncbi:hypothetical protein BDV06DRAFT_190262 [Aspergillus oleicola]
MSAAANRGAKIILHSLERSRSQRILWLLEELNLFYEIKPYKRGLNERAPAELKGIHPIGKAPILEIHPPQIQQSSSGNVNGSGSGRPCILAESAVIVEHLLEHFHRPSSSPSSYSSSTQTNQQIQKQQKRLTPTRWITGQENQIGGETETYRRYRYYMHYCEGSLMPLVVTNVLMDVVKSAPPFFLRPLIGIVPFIVKREYTVPNFKTHLGFLEEQLLTSSTQEQHQHAYLTGPRFTAADILMSYPLIILKEVGVLERGGYPALWDYVERLREMEGYKKAVRILEDVEGQRYRPF